MKKGFTLIELLAVIVILAIIAIIAVPIVLNIIDDTNKSAFKNTAEGILNAAELYFSAKQLDLSETIEDVEFNLPEDANTKNGLQLKGNIPTGTVKVTQEGKVSIAVQNGRYCITKGLNETEFTITEDVENCIIPIKIINMELTSESELLLIGGETTQIDVNIEPSDATNKKLNYTLDKQNIVTISETGLVTAVNPGIATITVSTTDGSNISETINVTVKQPIENLDLGISSLTLNTKETYQIAPNITPNNAENKTLTYASSKTSVATVSETGLVTAKFPGTSTITVTTTDGTGISKTISLTIKQLAESLTLNKESITIGIGDDFDENITTQVLPNNTSTKTLKWTSADPSIATVSNGTITGVSLGTTTVTATTTDGTNISKTINVTVSETYTNGIMQSGNNCINEGVCSNGTTVKVAVSDDVSYKFYVIKDDNYTLTLIMNENLGNNVAWINAEDYAIENNKDEVPDICSKEACNDEGPITAINYLDKLTDEEWSNISKKEYVYNVLDTNGNKKCEDITKTMKVRMITISEVSELITSNNGISPNWFYGGESYWVSRVPPSAPESAYFMNKWGSWNYTYVGATCGVRPVIELTK